MIYANVNKTTQFNANAATDNLGIKNYSKQMYEQIYVPSLNFRSQKKYHQMQTIVSELAAPWQWIPLAEEYNSKHLRNLSANMS